MQIISEIFNPRSRTVAESDNDEDIDNDDDEKISRLQELREKEKVYKESYSIMDEMIMCLRCLLD